MSWSEIAFIATAAVLLVVVVSFVLYAKKTQRFERTY